MTLLRAITIVFLLNCAIFIKCSAAERSDDQYLASIIDHLNSKQDKIYNFNNGLFVLKKHLRTDVHVYNVTLDVNEKCTAPYPEEPCYERPLRCTATMVDDGKTVKVLDDVQCTHNPVIQPPAQIGQDGLGGMMMIEPPMRKNKIEVSHESVYSDPETLFVAERYNPQRPCLGCLFDLNVNSVGVNSLVDSALRHIESEHENKFILGRVLRLQQQVVNGVKYILLAEVVSSLCEKTSTVFDCPPNANEQPLICEIHYIEKPWISTSKHIISNNCTQSQEFTLFKNDQDNEIKVNDRRTNNNEMSASRLAELESQILLDSERNFGEMEFNRDDELRAVEEIGKDNSRISNPLVVEELAPVVIERKRLDPIEVKSVLPELMTADLRVDEEPSIFEDIMPDYQNDQSLTQSLSSTDPATIIETSSKKVETTSRNTKDKSSEEDSSEEDNKPKNRKKRSCVNDKKEEDSSSSEEENKKEKCNSNSEEKNQKIVKKDDSSSSSSSSSSEEDDNNVKQNHKRSIGELEKISLEEKPLVKELADYAAKTLDKIDNDKDKRVVLQILGAKKLRLDGTYYSLILRMGVSQCLEEKSNTIDCLTNLHENLTKICKVQIHVGDNDDYINWKLIKSQCQNIKKDEYDRNRTNYSRYKRGVPGAPVPASVKDPQVLAFVKDTLPHLDSELKSANKHKVLNVESVTKQVVAGLKYRIKVSFGLSECGLNDIQDVEKCNQLEGDKPKVCELVVWDRPWLNNTQYNLNCNAESIRLDFEKVARSKREALFGAPEESSIDDPEILLFVKESLPHLDKELQTTNKHKLHNVVSVTKQVVAGISYKIKMYLTLSDCGINDVKEVENCNQLKGDEPKLCELNVWERSWLKETKYDLNCNENTVKVKFEKNGRTKRQAAVGAPVEASKDDPQILLFVKDSLPHLDKQLQSTNKHKLQNIVSVTKQVVAGVSYKINMYLTLSDCLINDVKEVENCKELKGDAPKLCKLTVWDRPWLKQTEYKLNCNEDSIKVEFEKNGRSKRQAAVGSPIEASKDDPDILLFVKESLPHLDKELQSKNKHKVQNIVSATKQVVAGVSYKIQMNVILSECGIEDAKEVETCNELKGDVPKSCKLTVWDRPWLKQTVYDLNCNENAIKIKFEKNANSRTKRQALGAPAEASKDDPQVLLYVKESLPHLDKELQTTNKHKLHNVVSVTQQVVQGVSYKIKMYLTLSDCGINDVKEVENCNQLKGDEPKLCELNVWDRSWLKDTKYELNCNENTIKVKFEKNGRSKRQVPGAPVEASKDDPQILLFAKESLPHLDKELQSTNKHKLQNIVSATKQVVAGVSYKIQMNVILSECGINDLKEVENCNELKGDAPKSCKLTVWDRPWLKQTQYKLNCNQDTIKVEFENGGSRSKRQIPGGAIDASKDANVYRFVVDGVTHLNSQVGATDNNYKANEIVRATKRIVAGTLYEIVVDLRDKQHPNGRECEFKIWDQPWTNFRQTNITCDDLAHSFQSNSLLAENRVTKRSVVVSSSLGDRRRYVIPGTINGKHDPSIFKHIHNALRYLDQFSPSDNKYHLKDLVDVDKQTVSGNVYRFLIQIGLSDCSKYTEMEYCEIPAENPLKLCTVKVWTREWLNSNEEYSIKCDDDKEAEYNFKMSELEANKRSERKVRQSFEEYKIKFNKTYTTQSEHAYRYRVFRENLNRIDLFNKKEQGTATYGVTKFADLTHEEFSKSLGLRPDLRSDENEVPFKMATIPNIDIPEEFDWRAKNAVTVVKNQGLCGSCWAFSTTGNVEGQYAIKYGKLLEFSEQELVDCDKVDQGCDGGLMDNAYRVIEKLGGLETEKDYPYDADDEKCHFSKQKVVVQLSGALNISQDEGAMANWLVKNGPIAIAINANAMQFYIGGVSHPWKFLCNPTSLDHGVLIVGYGVYKDSFFNKTEPYWIVKNSWGSFWGEQGYYRVYRGDGTCGLNQTPSSAIVA